MVLVPLFHIGGNLLVGEFTHGLLQHLHFFGKLEIHPCLPGYKG